MVGNTYLKGNLKIDGNISVKRPYGMFSSEKTQTVAVINTAYPMDFNVTEDSYLIQKYGDQNFGFSVTGDYKVELSIIAKNSSAIPGSTINIWVQKNGVNIPRSNTPYVFKAQNAIAVIAVPFILDMNTTDRFRVMYSSDSTATTLPYLGASAPVPSTPSAIMTIDKISEIT